MPGFSIQMHADGSLRDDWPDSDVINVLSREFNALQEPFFKEVGMEKEHIQFNTDARRGKIMCW